MDVFTFYPNKIAYADLVSEPKLVMRVVNLIGG